MVVARLFRISRQGPGQLSTMAAPRGGDWLADEMDALSLAGVSTVVCLLTEQENQELALTDQPEAAGQRVPQFVQLPTPDRGLPEATATRAHARSLITDLQAGSGVAIHCRAGIGRSSVLAAAVLQLEGCRPTTPGAASPKPEGYQSPTPRGSADSSMDSGLAD